MWCLTTHKLETVARALVAPGKGIHQVPAAHSLISPVRRSGDAWEEDRNMERLPVNPGTVEWSGENPGMYLKEAPEGPFVTLISFFRVLLSPHGSRFR